MSEGSQQPAEDSSKEGRAIRAGRELMAAFEALSAKQFFEKSLTSSDIAGTGRVVIPKAIAEQYFPRLEQPSGLLVKAVDTFGREYTFKFRFWINNQSRMYLLEGAGELHRTYDMGVGDVMVFGQKPDNGLVIAGRPATKGDATKKPPVKRPAGEGGRAPRASKPRNRAGERSRAAGGGGEGAADQARRRRKPGAMDVEPAIDGVFRAVPNGVVAQGGPSGQQGGGGGGHQGGVYASKHGRWVVTLNLAGELYQAFFDTQEDALEAHNATGFNVSPSAVQPVQSAVQQPAVQQQGVAA